MTEAERRVWQVLRSQQMKGFKFRRQVPIGRYIADFVCHEARLIVEIDGGQHDRSSPREAERTGFLQNEGYLIARFWNNEVLANLEGVHQTIADELGRITPPNPPPSRGRAIERRRQMTLPPGRFDYAPINDRPNIKWPNNARVAFWVAPNMEFFEYLPENRPTQPDIPLYSRMDYGNRVGFWRMLDVLNKHALRACCCLNLEILDHFPEIKDAMVAADWDYMAHGLYNSRPIYDLTEEQERLLAGLHHPSQRDDRQAPEGTARRRRRVHGADRRFDG
jgi:very-short-patch-repair endonuclease